MTVTPEQLELAVLSSLKSTSDVYELMLKGIAEDSFQIESNALVWRYMTALCVGGGLAFPTHEDVTANTGVQLLKDVTDKVTPVEELIRVSMHRRAVTLILKRQEEIKLTPDIAIRNLIGDLSALTKTTQGHTSYYDQDADARLKKVLEYVDNRDNGKFTGIATGLDVFDQNGDTWSPGELVSILGRTNIGKSWLLFYLCAYAYFYSDKKILILSPESTNFDIEARMDCIMGNFMGYRLSNHAIRKGLIDRDMYTKFMKELKAQNRRDLVVRDSGDSGVFTISDIIALTREHSPDILAIDGFHLIKGLGKSWENIKDAAESIKGTAQHMGITVLVASQSTRSTSMMIDDTPEIGEAAYGMGLMEASNRVISLADVKGNKQRRIFKVPKFRDGEIILNRQYLHYDVDYGDIRQVIPDTDNTTGEVDF